ncbi:MAG TPA: retroviral-like aspartic protease family protein [Planctomycetota bacterium]|nr:retroviral-like aspartic protease family protein [Planctomycetota bacterium]HRR79026.1 retroviral-like aspartic protease family protein [Planctomycetota bacterium]HRT93833.1 retroviral-like aspartic protease family protein [Planctomycetota bacterium]
MGLTNVEAKVANPFHPARHKTLRFLVDSGAVYSVIPRAELERLGIEATGERTFFLANGVPIRRQVGEARITFEGQTATCVVLFGEEGDSALLGVTTLENLGLIFDPLRQKIMPLPMLIADVRRLFPN